MLRAPSFVLAGAASLLISAGCTQSAQPVTLRSLESSGRFSFLCMGTPDDTVTDAHWTPRDIADCPDVSYVDGENRDSFAMVTQVTRGEVALVDVTAGRVIDAEPTVPGYNFVPIGAQPTSIASTPGSLATFVGVAEVGKEGIFALPTSCVIPRKTNAPVRDLTTWPACRLPVAPGEIAVVIDGPPDPTQPDVYAQACGEAPKAATSQAATLTALGRDPDLECPADLSTETKHPGRRKLVVSLPELQEIVVIDAQDLLNREPGKFEPCDYADTQIRLRNKPTAPIVQIPPPDLDLSSGRPAGFQHSVLTVGNEYKPAGFAQVDDATTHEHRLFVADSEQPVIHEFDTTDACNIVEKPDPLTPVSFVDPNRVVTTTRIAASPLTVPGPTEAPTAAKRYLYAVDDANNGSVMFFDISPGATNKAPLLRPHATLLPFEPPDRIAFDSPARDVAFALRDHVQIDPTTGTQQIGQFCDPDPTLPATDPRALYRPASDLSTGAAPSFLRGLFGFVALASGHVAVIDLQDFDAPCRRPVTANPGAAEDFRGCAGDAVPQVPSRQFVTDTGPTVTNEVTCQTIEPNRVRSSAALRNDLTAGIHAPSLRAFPTLISDTGRTLQTNVTPEGLQNPRMLGVNFSAKDKAQVWVGTTLYSIGDPANPLVVDPARAAQSSLVLSFREPRAFAPSENFSAVFEGVTVNERPAGTLDVVNGSLLLSDGGASYCDFGVQAGNIAAQRADAFSVGPSDTDRALFAQDHADHILIKSELLDQTDTYWHKTNGKPNAGALCGLSDPNEDGAGYLLCQTEYGSATVPSKNREFRVTLASRSQLTLEPRVGGTTKQNERLADLVHCCFPQQIAYDVRASNEWVVRGSASPYRHNIGYDSSGNLCAISTDPLKSRLTSRVVEVSCRGTGGHSDCAPNATGAGTIGLAGDRDVACVYPANALPTAIPDPNQSGCVFNGLFGTFVIYRGSQPTLPDYEFDWTVVGGFSPLLVNLSATTDTNTSPTSMAYSDGRQGLVISDGSSKGLVVVDLATFGLNIYY